MDVVNVINKALRGLFGMLCETIYPAIASLYDFFIELSLIMYTDRFTIIYNKISLIIGIFMVFRVIFWLIQSLVNPDNISDKEKNPGKIIQKVLISVILLATTPTIFEYAMELQNKIINSKIIENVISIDKISDSTTTGRFLAAELFINFYTPTEIIGSDGQTIIVNDEDCTVMTGKDGYIYTELFQNGKINDLDNKCLTQKINNDDKNDYVINFNGLFATAVGIFVLWMILMYCISVGTRIIQLIFLQIIAPIPIMCYLTPKKDSMFSKWLQQCTTTYLDLFIRLVIINFVMLLCEVILRNENSLLSNVSSNNFWIEIFLVLGLLTFAKKAPELIQELFPKGSTKASGDFGLSWKKRTDNMLGGKLVYGASRMATYGVAGAAATGVVGFLGGRGAGRISGMLGGMARGLASGAKSGSALKNIQSSIKQQTGVNKKKIDWENNGSTFPGRLSQRMANALGYEGKSEELENKVARYDKKLKELNAKSSAYKEVSSSVGKMEDRATNQLDNSTFKSTQIYQRDLQQRRRYYKALSQAMDNGDTTAAYSLATSELNRANIKIAALVSAGKGPGTKEYDQANDEKNRIQAIRDSITNGTYNAAQASADMTDVLTETRNEYITKSLQDQNGDKVIRNEAQHIENVVSHSDNSEAFKNFANSSTGTTYEEYDKFSGEAKGANTKISQEIYKEKTAKEAITNSEEYQRAKADRDAVGGHSGKKS